MDAQPNRFTGQPSPGASLPLPVSPSRSLAEIQQERAETAAVTKAVRETLERLLASHPDLEGHDVEVLATQHPTWRWIDLKIDGKLYSLSTMKVRT